MYAEFLQDWQKMKDTHKGERRVKERGVKYLPPTSGMIADGMQFRQPGLDAYNSYRTRARFPDIVTAAVEALVGIMHSKPPTIELPDRMEPMREMATNRGESLEVLLRRINEQQLITGRLGLLLDVPDGAPVGVMPYIAMYESEAIRNWDDGEFNHELVRRNINLVILDESGPRRVREFEWEQEDKYRVLLLGDVLQNEGQGGGIYRAGVFTENQSDFNENELIEPSIAGRSLDFVPFTFINACDVVSEPDKPPLLGLAELALGIYRGEADYRQALFMQGQDTLVVIGNADPDKTWRTGAGAVISLPTGPGHDAKFIGVDSSGLPEMRNALENDKAEATERSGTLIDSTGSGSSRQSGDALRIRVVSRTATLNQLAKTGAFGLQQCLRQAAVWLGANPEQVIVTPNLDFVNDTIGGEELVKLATAKSLGAPLSNVSIHEQMREKGLSKMTLEEELQAISDEEPLNGSTAADELPEDEPEQENNDDGDGDN